MPENLQEPTRRLKFDDVERTRMLFGEHNGHLQRIAGALDLTITSRGNVVNISGDAIAATRSSRTVSSSSEVSASA